MTTNRTRRAHQFFLRFSASDVDGALAILPTMRPGLFVATNAVSLSQALFAPEAWYRAICRGDQAVGFVMLEDQSLRTPPPPIRKSASGA